MATTPEDILRSLIDAYANIESIISARVARDASVGATSPAWASDKLAAAQQTRRWAAEVLDRATGPMRERVLQAVLLGFVRGGSAASGELSRLSDTAGDWLMRGGTVPTDRLMAMVMDRRLSLAAKLAEVERSIPGGAAINRLALSLAAKIEGTHPQILRWVDDAYRTIIASDVAPSVLSGVETRAVAMRRAWTSFAERGITGFIDKSGRQWALTSYIEMASRTTVANAATAGRLDRFRATGINYVIVVDHAHECPKCRPWEGKILATSGPDGRRDVLMNDETGREPARAVAVAGTVAEATRAGLFHPNCEHSLGAYVHGATKVPTGTADPKGYDATVKQRELERQVRRAKVRVAGAPDTSARTEARKALQQSRDALSAHLRESEPLGLLRRPQRERPGIGIAPTPGPTQRPA